MIYFPIIPVVVHSPIGGKHVPLTSKTTRTQSCSCSRSTSIRSSDPRLYLSRFSSSSLLRGVCVVRSGGGSLVSTLSMSRYPTRRSSRWWGRSCSRLLPVLQCVVEYGLATVSHLASHITKGDLLSLCALCLELVCPRSWLVV